MGNVKGPQSIFMKALLIYILLIISFKSTTAQDSIIGCYGRQDSQIELKADSTFFFFHAVDTYRGWVKGLWQVNGKQIIIVPKLVYDTISLKRGAMTVDSLILSRDYTSERLTQISDRAVYVFQYEQNEKLCPKLLEYEDNILYIIKNKKRQKEKIQGGYYIHPFNPWYIKNQCKY